MAIKINPSLNISDGSYSYSYSDDGAQFLYDGDYIYGTAGDDGSSGCGAEDLEAIDYYLTFHTYVDVYANTIVGLLGIAANMIVIPILCR